MNSTYFEYNKWPITETNCTVLFYANTTTGTQKGIIMFLSNTFLYHYLNLPILPSKSTTTIHTHVSAPTKNVIFCKQ